MQDYYNYTTKYQWGGKFITKFLGQGLRNARTLLNDSKIVPRLNGLARSFEGVDVNFSKQLKELSNLIKTHRVSEKPTNSPEVVSQLKRIQEYFSHNKNLPELRSKINEQTFTGRRSNLRGTPLGTSQSTSATQSARSPYLNGPNLSYTVPPSPRASKIRNARNKKAAQQNQAQNQAQGNPSREVTSTNPVPGTTLSGRWKQFRNWMNNHPTTTIGVPLLALGTGPGRYVTGHAFKFTQSNPESWFGNSVPESETASDFVMIDGTKIPIKRSAEGYFVPVNQNNNQTTTVEGDNVDQTLAGITNENLGGTPQQQPENMPQVDQQAINDLFDDDQW